MQALHEPGVDGGGVFFSTQYGSKTWLNRLNGGVKIQLITSLIDQFIYEL